MGKRGGNVLGALEMQGKGSTREKVHFKSIHVRFSSHLSPLLLRCLYRLTIPGMAGRVILPLCIAASTFGAANGQPCLSSAPINISQGFV